MCMYVQCIVHMYVHVCTTDRDTNGAEESVIVREVSSFQRLKCTQECYIWGGKRCPVGEVSSVQECLQRMNYHMDHSHVSTVCVSVEHKNWANCVSVHNRSCQERDWPDHRRKCGKVKAYPIGLPFVISLPANQLTYSKLTEYADKFSRYVNFYSVSQSNF